MKALILKVISVEMMMSGKFIRNFLLIKIENVGEM